MSLNSVANKSGKTRIATDPKQAPQQPCSLILAAHGSLAHENSNRPLFELAEKITETQKFTYVTPAFLNGQPNLNDFLDDVPTGDVIVVPMMTSEGYYSETVLPKRLAENSNAGRYRINVTPAIGVHPRLPTMVSERINSILQQHSLANSETTVVLVGHGTRRHPNSGTATYQLAKKIESGLSNVKIMVGFLDQDPTIESIANTIQTKNVLVIPFLISRGPHSTVDVPEAFGLPTGHEIEFPLVQQTDSQQPDNGITICDLPIGMYPEMAERCVEFANSSFGDADRLNSCEVDQ